MADAEKQKHFFETHMMDLFHRADSGNYPVFTDFLTTGEQSVLNGMKRQFKTASNHISLEFWGGHFDCSHVVGGFFPEEYKAYSRELFPVVCLCVELSGAEYSAALNHRDYLGAVLNLGIERSMIGDIRIQENRAFIFCKKEIASFIQEELRMVRHTAVSCHKTDNLDEIPKQQYEIISRTVASVRLDNIVAAMTGKARGKAAELITQGKVVVDSTERISVSYTCKDGSVISIRGYGKFRLQIPEQALTKKGKQKIQIYKYK